MLNRIKNAFIRFMYGRNGVDQFSSFLLILGCVFLFISSFIRTYVRLIFLAIFWAITIYSYFRIFSRNIYKRQAENNKYLSKVNYIKTRFSQRKNYRFYDCPKCKTHLRVPKGVGKVTITCKKCGYKFDKKA